MNMYIFFLEGGGRMGKSTKIHCIPAKNSEEDIGMKKRSRKIYSGLPRRVGAIALSAAMVAGSLYTDALTVSAAGQSWKADVEAALQEVKDAEAGADAYNEATEALQGA